MNEMGPTLRETKGLEIPVLIGSLFQSVLRWVMLAARYMVSKQGRAIEKWVTM